jgi:hypothetical protein
VSQRVKGMRTFPLVEAAFRNLPEYWKLFNSEKQGSLKHSPVKILHGVPPVSSARHEAAGGSKVFMDPALFVEPRCVIRTEQTIVDQATSFAYTTEEGINVSGP